MPVSSKQIRFVQEYTLDRNASRAAREAGYSAKSAKVTGCRLLTNANVAAAIRAEERDTALRVGLQRQDVVNGFLAAIELAHAQAQPAAAVAGWRELGKMLGYYVPEQTQIELSGPAAAWAYRLKCASDEELLQLCTSNR